MAKIFNPEREFGGRNWEIAVKRTADCLLISDGLKFAIECGLKALANKGTLLGVKVLFAESNHKDIMSGYINQTYWDFSSSRLNELKAILYEEALEYNEENERYIEEVQIAMELVKSREDIASLCKTFNILKTTDIEKYLLEKIKRRRCAA